MNLVDLISTTPGSVNALLLLLLLLDKPGSDLIKAQVNETIKKFDGNLKNSKEVREMVTWILDDQFKDETIIQGRRASQYFEELYKLKDSFINFYFRNLKEFLKEGSDIEKSCDIHTTIGEYALQLMRLRLVIQPEVNILTNPHVDSSGEKTLYLTAKAFWISNEGKRIRTFTKSLGLLSEYGKRDSDKAKTEAIIRLQPVIWAEYKSLYP